MMVRKTYYTILLAIQALLKASFAQSKCYDSNPNLLCLQHGTTGPPHLVSPTKNLIECYTWGLNKFASSIGFNPKNKTCHLFVPPLEDMGFTPGRSEFEYYDLNCFDCLNTCPVPPYRNLLLNPGFEQFPVLVTPWSATAGGVVQGGFNSSRKWRLMDIKPARNGIFQYVFGCDNDVNLVSFDYKFSWKKEFKKTNVLFSSGDMLFNIRPSLSKRNIWESATVLYHNVYSQHGGSPFGGANSFSAFVGRDVTFDLDNVVVQRIELGPASGPDAMYNSGFENGLNPWMAGDGGKTSSCELSSPGHQSSTALNCTIGGFSGGVTLSQVTATKMNKAYILSLDYKATSDDENGCQFYASLGGLDYVYSGLGVDGSTAVVSNNTWTTYTLSVWSPGQSAELNIYLRNNEGLCHITFDNISLYEAPLQGQGALGKA